MIYTTCPRCRKPVEVGKRCGCYERQRCTSRPSCELFYASPEWQTARLKAIKHTHCLDLWSLYVDGRIEHGRTVHHIVPLEEDYSKRSDPDNLIYLTEAHHRMIHELYRTGKQRETAAMLHSFLNRFEDEYGG